jgi:predicted patatin/cPLA2 family phospholipase
MQALVLEGGGMRGAYANGVLAAFEAADLGFEAVYGTSAGGALAAWWSAGQADDAAQTWDYVNDERILSYRRWLTRQGPLLDHDGLFEIVYEDERPLDVDAVQASDHPVVVTATEVETGDVVYHDLREGNVIDWLRATGRLPLASGPPVEIEGTRYLDGGLADPVPIEKAIEDGHDEIVVVLNRPERKSEAESWILGAVVGQRYPELFDLVRRHAEIWNEKVAIARDPPEGVDVSIVQPGEYLDLARLSRDEDKIENAIDTGRRDGRRWLVKQGGIQPAQQPPKAAARDADEAAR